MPESKNRIVVVLGMHRSGTSVATRSLAVFGVDLGETLLPGNEDDNAKGFFEDIDIYQLNIEMLDEINFKWDSLSIIEAADLQKLKSSRFLTKAIFLMRKKLAVKIIFGFKDPRVSILLPFWQHVFAHMDLDVSYLIAIRNPLSVAESLRKRDGFCHEKSYMLWLIYVLASLSFTHKQKRVVIDYDYFLDALPAHVALISRRLGLLIFPKEMERFQANFLSRSLKHNLFTLDDLREKNDCPALVLEVYEELHKYIENEDLIDGELFETRVSNWVNELHRYGANLRLVDQLLLKISDLIQSKIDSDRIITDMIKAIIQNDKIFFLSAFDSKWYLAENPDVSKSGVDPYKHYIQDGIVEGRAPSENLISFVCKSMVDGAKRLNLLAIQKNVQDINRKVEFLEKEKEFSRTLLDIEQQHNHDREYWLRGLYKAQEEFVVKFDAFHKQIESEVEQLSQNGKKSNLKMNEAQLLHDEKLNSLENQYLEVITKISEGLESRKSELRELAGQISNIEKARAHDLFEIKAELNHLQETWHSKFKSFLNNTMQRFQG